MKTVNYLILLLFTGLMIYASLGLANRGDPNAPIHLDESLAHSPGAAAYYIRNADHDAHTHNMVTVILADYRGYDTLGEETVIMTAGLICFLLLGRRKKKNNGNV